MGRIFDLGVRHQDTILIWGYAEEYASTKTLRTPALNDIQWRPLFVIPDNVIIWLKLSLLQSPDRMGQFISKKSAYCYQFYGYNPQKQPDCTCYFFEVKAVVRF